MIIVQTFTKTTSKLKGRKLSINKTLKNLSHNQSSKSHSHSSIFDSESSDSQADMKAEDYYDGYEVGLENANEINRSTYTDSDGNIHIEIDV